MARTPQPNSATSQFFINVVDNTFLDKAKAGDGVGYCVFGRVIDGMDVVDKIKAVEPGREGRDEVVVSGQWSVVSGQWSVVSGQWSVVSKGRRPGDHTPGLLPLLTTDH
jgi:hypothetical protein